MTNYTRPYFLLFLFFISLRFVQAQTTTETISKDSIYTIRYSLSTQQSFDSLLTSRSFTAYYSVVCIQDTAAGIPRKRCGVIHDSKIILPFEYDSIQYTAGHEFIVRRHLVARRYYACKSALLNVSIQTPLIDFNADRIVYLQHYIYAVRQNGTERLYNSRTNTFSKNPFQSWSIADSQFIITSRSEEYRLYHRDGSSLIETPFKTLIKSDSFLYNAVLYPQWDVYKTSGEKLFSSLLADSVKIDSVNNRWCLYRNGKPFFRRILHAPSEIEFSVPDSLRSVVTAVTDSATIAKLKAILKMDTIYFNSSGWFLYKRFNMYGYCDSLGNVRIAPQYDTLTRWYEGMAATKLRGKWGFIDRNEYLTVQPYYIKWLPFYNGSAAVYDGKKWSFINKSGKSINSLTFDSITYSSFGRWYVYSKGKVGLCGSGGKEIIPPTFDYLFDAGSDLIIFKEEGLYGIIRSDRIVIQKPVYDLFIYDAATHCFLLKHILETPLMFQIKKNP